MEVTPPKLKALEVEWKARRRKILEDISNMEVHSVGMGSAAAVGKKEASTEVVQKRQQREGLSRILQEEGKMAEKESVATSTLLIPRPAPTFVRFHASQGSAPPTPPDTPPPLPVQHPTTRTHVPSPFHLPPPPTPPTASPTNPQPQPTSPVIHIPPDLTRRPSPILAGPLPPTFRPVRLRPDIKDTIHVLLSPSIDVVLSLAGGRLVRVLAGGRAVELAHEDEGGALRLERKLEMDGSEKWSGEDLRVWEGIRKAVEVFKKRAARVKLYHQLGNLIITCSSPPDIILSFRLRLPNQPGPHGASSRPAGASPACAMPTSDTVKIRVAYSRVSRELRIDTSSTRADCTTPKDQGLQLVKERLRTKRVVASTSPERVSAESGAEGLGLVGVDMSEWREEEREAVKRIWGLRGEWARWDRLESG
ncbi:hypothetical protein IAT38_003327 [Cryptococcus sp. DSM 104549]